MRSAFPLVLGLWVLTVTGTAQAQFANRSLSLSAGYLNLDHSDSGVDSGIPMGLGSSLYIEDGFDLTFNLGVMILREQITGKQVVGVTPATGVRYLFSEERIRPYVGADLSFLWIFGVSATQGFVGVGPNLGLDCFVSDTVSVGLKGLFNAYLMLNAPVTTSLGVTGNIATYF